MPACGECKYFGWLGLVRYCRHPDHVAPLKKWPGKCPDFLDWEVKGMPNVEPKWPMPVSMAEWYLELKKKEVA